jgi:antitoxin MazE
MKVAKWGNSLAVRIPASLAIELGLEEGDNLKLVRNPDGSFGVSSNEFEARHRSAVEWMRAPKAPTKLDYAIDRELLDGFDQAS